MAIELVLLQDVEKLGQAGQVVRVSSGYARNYLLPRHLAVQATQGVISGAKKLAENRQAEMRKALEASHAFRDRLEALECRIPVKVGREEKLFGSVTTTDIAEALQKLGVEIDRRKIHLGEPIKALGEYKVAIKIHPQVEASLKVGVVRE